MDVFICVNCGSAILLSELADGCPECNKTTKVIVVQPAGETDETNGHSYEEAWWPEDAEENDLKRIFDQQS